MSLLSRSAVDSLVKYSALQRKLLTPGDLGFVTVRTLLAVDFLQSTCLGFDVTTLSVVPWNTMLMSNVILDRRLQRRCIVQRRLESLVVFLKKNSSQLSDGLRTSSERQGHSGTFQCQKKTSCDVYRRPLRSHTSISKSGRCSERMVGHQWRVDIN